MALKQLEPTVQVVAGCKFYITPFSAFKAANLTGELASTLAPLLGALAPLAGNGNIMDIDASKAGEAMSNCTGISGDKIEKLMRSLLLGGHIVIEENQEFGIEEAAKLDEDIINEVFCGNVQDMFILCFHVIRLNYKGFFGKLTDLSGKAGAGVVAKMKRTIL